MKKAHFLHVGKTGGNAVKDALRPYIRAGRYKLILHSHPTTVDDVRSRHLVFFGMRDPIDRFVSGFCQQSLKPERLSVVES